MKTRYKPQVVTSKHACSSRIQTSSPYLCVYEDQTTTWDSTRKQQSYVTVSNYSYRRRKKKQEKETRSPYLDYEEQNKSIITLTKIFKGNSGIFGAHVEPYIRQIKTQKIKNNFCLKMSQQQGKFKNSELNEWTWWMMGIALWTQFLYAALQNIQRKKQL